ncbi:MAG: cellulase family glycosylhydrolase [bacterium]
MNKIKIAFVLLIIFGVKTCFCDAAISGVPQARLVRLTSGINVGWLNSERFKLNRSAAEGDAQLIKATGCRHVRLYLNVDGMRDAAAREKPDVQKLPELDAAIEIVLKQDMAVIVDPFHYGKNDLLKFPGPDDPEAEVMVKFWTALAAHLATFDPERVFLEVANEPALVNPLDWYAVEIRILKAMRVSAPKHTFIAGYNMRTETDWNGIKALVRFPEIEDKNIVYNFHYYNPMTLTHQGAPWVDLVIAGLRDVPYPADPAVLNPLIARTVDPQAKRLLEVYRDEGWDRKKIDAELTVVSEWAKKRGVLVTCNEFGVFGGTAPLTTRVNWTRDVREALEKLGIGWTVWDGSFGFLCQQNGRSVVDEPIAKALGLQAPRPVSLAGQWQFRLDSKAEGVASEWFKTSLPESIELPGSTEQRGFGVKATQPTIGKLTRVISYEGPAWYQREITVPAAWKGKRVELFFERCHWETTTWVDGQKIGMQNSLCVPHIHDLGMLSPGKHRLTICVDNTYKINIGRWVHALTEDTQGNWNGIIGRIELRATDPVWIRSVQVYQDKLLVKVGNCTGKSVEAIIQGSTFTIADGCAEVTVPFADEQALWDEFSPKMREINVKLEAGNYSDTKIVPYGLRQLGIKDKQFVLNGRPVMMRGAVDECVYPLTGYPPMDKVAWRRVLNICKSYGFNFMRFHSWCPPEAAFEAADELGFFFQAELPLWTMDNKH